MAIKHTKYKPPLKIAGTDFTVESVRGWAEARQLEMQTVLAVLDELERARAKKKRRRSK
jgi:hypothetical protein